MTTDDLLREASDPNTPGERLEELWREAFSDDNESPIRWLLVSAVMRNPSTPCDLLEDRLLMGNRDVWHNPLASLLLQRGPLPEYENAAHLALDCLHPEGYSQQRFQSRTLAEEITWWAVRPSSDDDQARHLACRVADLFHLPWPKETP